MYYFDKLKELLTDASPEIQERVKQVDQELERAELERLKDSEREYWDTVEAVAKEVVDEGYDIEQVDGNYWVIYYHAAHKVWQYSPNEDAVFADGEGLDGCDSMCDVLTRMAYHAFRADVQCKVDELQAEKGAAEEEDDEDDDEDEGEEEA